MKTTKILYVIVIIAGLFCSCDKEELPADRIFYTPINKTITLSNPDSIEGVCYDIIFEIIETDASGITVMTRLDFDPDLLCNGFNEIIAAVENGDVLILGENQLISEDDNWQGVGGHGLCLDNFAGKGEKYIGYRAGFFPSGVTDYNYGWIKIELSANKDTLKIIDRATNYTENKGIKTGQMK